MRTLLIPLLHTLAAAVRSRAALHLEILALRQQLAVLHYGGPKRSHLRPVDRFFWVCLSKLWPGWRKPLIIVKTDTVVAWSRKGFRLFWTWKSRRGRSGRPGVAKDVRDLIRTMSLANPLWGAPRVHGELLKLGITVSQPTVAKYMVRHRKPPSQTWRTFLANHAKDLVSVDFFTVPTVTFRVFFVFIVLAHDRRRVIHFNVTEQPTAAWTAQQIVEAFPWDTAPRYLLRDRDGIYADYFRGRITAMDIDDVPIAARSPWQSPYVERLIGSIRRECLDHMIVLNEQHLRQIIACYLRYYHAARTHLSLEKDAPDGRAIQPPTAGTVVAVPHIGGLHHEYVRRAA
jgi:hypothetical protein